jgi:hypothetical protein
MRGWTWAALKHRAFGIDVLARPQCGGKNSRHWDGPTLVRGTTEGKEGTLTAGGPSS